MQLQKTKAQYGFKLGWTGRKATADKITATPSIEIFRFGFSVNNDLNTASI